MENNFVLLERKELIERFDVDYYELLMLSLCRHFTYNNEIEEKERLNDYIGRTEKLIYVDNAQTHTDSTFEFEVMFKSMDVYFVRYLSAFA